MELNYEARALSAVLKDKQIFVLLNANPDALFGTHGDIWEFIKDYYAENKTTPPVELVTETFRDFDFDDKVGATKHHLNELRTDYLTHRVDVLLKSGSLKKRDENARAALDWIIQEASQIKRETADMRDLDMIDVEDALEYFRMVEEANKIGSFGVRAGIVGFDQFMPQGMVPGNFGVVLGFPQLGKSWLIAYMAVQAWKAGKKPMFVSLEMSEAEVRNRLYTIMGEGVWSHRKLSAGDVDREDFRLWGERHLKDHTSFQVVSNDGMGEFTPAMLRGKIDQYKPDIVFVDYIQLMASNTAKFENEASKIKNISREFKLLANSNQVPIVAIASATADENTDMTQPPTLNQIRWGRDIAYDADFVLAIGRDPNDTIMDCVFRKNRNGFLGEFLLNCNFDKGVWKDHAFDH